VKIIVGALVVILSTAAAVRADDHPFEVSGGYAYLNDQTNSQKVPRGWTGGVAGAVNPWLTIAGEVDGSYIPAVDSTLASTSIYSFLAGPRYVFRVHERVTAFGQFLIGDVHASTGVYAAGATTDDLAYQPGGGIDIAFAPRWAVRFQGDFRSVRDAGTTFNQERFVAGVVFRR
jgi:outer membrane protein with beta-barrel domain